MDKKSKIFFAIIGLLIVASVAVTYWRIMLKKDYVIEAQTDCDPYTEKCFLWECDPESDVEGEACTGDPEEDSWYFQVARRNAANIPLCDPDTDETCDPWTCTEGEKDCATEFCTAENMEGQYAVACNDPVKYAEENPIEEEAVECEDPPAGEAGGDTECEAVAAEEVTCEEGDTECEAAASTEEEATPDEAVDKADATTAPEKTAFPVDPKASAIK
ncbi:MAG: hypothetical protein WC238_03820 [Parcubacteria group bacterium]|jgi:hypothetical protein